MSIPWARSFSHGVHPPEHKDTAGLPTRRMPFVERYVLPLNQHIGAPARAVVSVGQRVRRAERVAEPGGFVSTSIHSPVAGTVVALDPWRHPNGQLVPAIEIAADPYATQELSVRPRAWLDVSRSAFVQAIQDAGLVGMGGAAFPSHVKLAEQKDKPVRWLVLNGCECEPFLTSDHRLMVERPEAIVAGVRILIQKLGAEGAKIGVELNKRDAIAALEGAVGDDGSIRVVPLRVKYPQGAEKMLIAAVFGEEVPAGRLPIDLGMVVNNVATVAAIGDYFRQGQPLIERIVTVAGPGIQRPANLIVPIGTPVRAVLEYCGLLPESREIIMGGPMMGQPLASLDVPVLKGTSGLLAFTDGEVDRAKEYQCVRCGRCLEACGNSLNPSRLARLARARRYEDLEAYFVSDCMECGACTFACPSGIPIVQLIRVAKGVVRERKAKGQ